ncbi:MAG: cobalamin B12-binding domain-containing protein, partial [Polyangiaceae bacterium]|nr:cobalamin B12-binding domain-containing protein [Polyangiaceae bacterium]
MHIALVGPDLEENLSLRYLSASLKSAGHSVTIVAFEKASDQERVRTAVRSADLVGLSMCYQIRAREFFDLVDAIKKDHPSRPIIAGGHYASCEAHTLLERHHAIDVIAIHEAEQTIVELAALPELTANALSNIQGIVYRAPQGIVATPPREILADLDKLPWADR